MNKEIKDGIMQYLKTQSDRSAKEVSTLLHSIGYTSNEIEKIIFDIMLRVFFHPDQGYKYLYFLDFTKKELVLENL